MEIDKEENQSTVSAIGSRSYPEPEVEYHQLVDNPQLFLEELRNFHSSFGTHFNFPTVGGAIIDLHRLFVEVTYRGGLDQVIRDRKWEDVISVFKFESSGVRGSFLLRKYYVSLLYHFEQAYFFRKRVVPSDAMMQIPVVRSAVESTKCIDENSTSTSSSGARVQIEPGISLIGVLDEKFDNGYVVSVNVGSDILKGILYHIPDGPQPSWSPDPGMPQRRKRKKSRLSLLDPSKVKPSSDSYNYFTEDYATLKPSSQGQEDWALVE